MHKVAPLSESMLARDRLRWRLAFGGMVVAMVIFGANFVVSRQAILNGLSPHDLLALRFGTAGLILLPTFLSGGLSTCGGVGWGRGATLAIMSGLPMSYLLLTGLTYAPAAHGATIGPGLVTVIGIVGGVILFATVLTRQLVLGIGAVLFGLACLAIAGSTHTNPTILLGDLCFLGVGLIWGCYPLLIQLWRVDALKATAIVSVLSMAYLPFYALFYFRGFDVAPWWVIVLHAINQGLLNVILGLWIWSWAARVLGPAVVGRFPPMIPVIGTLLGIPVLGEIPSGLQIVGIGLIIGGLLIASWRRSAPAALELHQAEIPDYADGEPQPQR
ncbi:Permease of the drug/metabolite transporter (DMT) superfamily [Bosea sp. OK403]|nr:Permease of the drug/metabolite transporter (DMT) superfamily [Bosea sp. OK403]